MVNGPLPKAAAHELGRSLRALGARIRRPGAELDCFQFEANARQLSSNFLKERGSLKSNIGKKRESPRTCASGLAATVGSNAAQGAAATRGQVMRFLLRMAFWLTVVLALLPSGGSQPAPKVNVSAIDAMSAAAATVTDMRSFCERQPDACTVGSHAAVAIGQRAQAGAKMLYEYLNEHFGSRAAAPAENAAAGKAVPIPASRPSQHTLSPGDLAPAWRGPQPRKEARSDQPA
jgi:hypothetical protein